ncbi:MAG: hypothetical protein ACKOB3_04330, partial [Holophagaceae bacterium]
MDVKAIRVIPFSGKSTDWNRWSKTFLANQTAKGNREVILPTNPGAPAAADPDKNTVVYNDLILSCQEDIIFGIVDESVSATFPDGDARVAWKSLREKFEPTTGAAKVQAKKDFHQLKLSSVTEDPDDWITQLELLRRRLKTLGTDILDEDLMLHILNHLPKEYSTTIELSEEDISNSALTLKTLKERIRARYARLQKEQEESDDAVALMITNKFKGACNVCGKIGHKGADCWTLDKNKAKKEEYLNKRKQWWNSKGRNKNKAKDKSKDKKTDAEETEVVLMAGQWEKFEKHTWIADSGASSHMCNDLSVMYDMKPTDQTISIGDGRKMSVTKIGKIKGQVRKDNGELQQITLTNVSYVPDLLVNLFSLTVAMEKDCTIVGSKKGMEIRKGKWALQFHTKFGTAKGHVFGTNILPMTEVAFVSETTLNKTVEEAHQLLGHPGKSLMEATSARLNWKLTGDKDTSCEECMIAKAKRENVNKVSKNPSTIPGSRISINISSVKTPEHGQKGRYWLLVVDEATNMKWSFFLATKKQQVPVLQGFIKTLKEMGNPVKYIRCDNAGENESLKKQLDLEGSNIRFEFTARMTPQQNGKVERAFATLYGRMREMMSG